MLVQAAAKRFGVNPNACRAANGHVLTGPRDKRLAYGELVEEAAKLPIPDHDKVTLKNPSDFKIVGKDTPRVDVPSKVDGSAVFGLDVRVRNLFAVIARCPTCGGKPKSFDATKAKAVRGVREVLEIRPVRDAHTTGGIAVVADSTYAAIKGREALQIEWDHGPAVAESSATLRKQFEELLAKPGTVVRNDGDAEEAIGKGARRAIRAAVQAHATMEPMSARPTCVTPAWNEPGRSGRRTS
jgi:isoquinoline 1-oxidoreductase beta subunit